MPIQKSAVPLTAPKGQNKFLRRTIMVRYDVYEEKVRGLYKTLEEAGYSL
ncbi:MAG: hypothetical protein IJY84_05340 [Clostridia bacterium]|nr:hypothetical protein [Clostridia bacterium]